MKFLNETYEKNYFNIAANINLSPDDLERKSLFYIIASNDDLYNKKDSIYDFKENYINLNVLNCDNTSFCSSSQALIRLGFNLYNGYSDDSTNPLDILKVLDYENYTLVKKAINIRFNR